MCSRIGGKRCNSIALMATHMLQATLAQDVVSLCDAGAPHTAIGAMVGSLVRIFEPDVQIAWFERATSTVSPGSTPW